MREEQEGEGVFGGQPSTATDVDTRPAGYNTTPM